MLKDPCNILQSRPGPHRTPAQPRAVSADRAWSLCLAATLWQSLEPIFSASQQVATWLWANILGPSDIGIMKWSVVDSPSICAIASVTPRDRGGSTMKGTLLAFGQGKLGQESSSSLLCEIKNI